MDVEAALQDLDEFNLSEVYHLTHVDNLSSIAERGVLPKNALRQGEYVDVSLDWAQEKRDTVYVPLSPRRDGWAQHVEPLHDLVPAFVAPKNPMSSKRRSIAHDLCWLIVDPRRLCDGDHEIAFTNGNLASGIARPYLLGFDSLEKMPWKVLRARTWKELEDGSVRRGAELLFWPKVEWTAVVRIEVLTPDARTRVVRSLSGRIAPTRVTVAPHNFFRSDD